MSNLVDCCEPVFQLVCRLRRSVEHRVPIDYSAFRKDMVQAWGEVERRCAEHDRKAQFETVRPLLFLFADRCIITSHWAHAAVWQQEAVGREIRAIEGEATFTAYAERWLRSGGKQNDELVSVISCMLSLGFPLSASARARLWTEISRHSHRPDLASRRSARSRIFTDAYAFTDRRDFVTPAAPRVGLLLLLAGSIVLVLLGVNILVFRLISSDLRQTLVTLAERSAN